VPAEIERMIKSRVIASDGLTSCTNNAIFTTGRANRRDLARGVQKTIDVGLTAYWYATKCAIELMLPARKGAIVNTASVSGLAGDYTLGHTTR